MRWRRGSPEPRRHHVRFLTTRQCPSLTPPERLTGRTALTRISQPRPPGESGLEVSDLRRLKELEDEKRRLKKIVAYRALNIEALKMVAEGNS